jgi:hypothetical protein
VQVHLHYWWLLLLLLLLLLQLQPHALCRLLCGCLGRLYLQALGSRRHNRLNWCIAWLLLLLLLLQQQHWLQHFWKQLSGWLGCRDSNCLWQHMRPHARNLRYRLLGEAVHGREAGNNRV